LVNGKSETIDYPHPITKGVPGNTRQGACYPASGVMTITINPSWTLAPKSEKE
jgi:hypothetical protein